MPKYVLIYHGGKHPEDEGECQKVMDDWNAWIQNLGDSVIDPGLPMGKSKVVMSDGVVVDNGGLNPASGFSVITAKNMEEALSKVRACPHLDIGGNIELAESFEM